MNAPRSVGSVAALVASLLLGAAARAAEPVRLSYEAPAECPNEATFVERVRERTSHVELAPPGALARNFSVVLSVDATGAGGRVDFVDVDGVPVSRAVRGATCDEVTSGLARVTALALGATVNDTAPEEPRPEPPPVTPPAPAQPTPPASVRGGPPPPARTAPGEATAGIGAGFVGWAGPRGGLSLDAFLAWAFRPQGPSLRLSAWHWRASDESAGREATFLGWGGRLEGCPLRIARERVFAEPCLGTNLGLFRAKGFAGPAVSRGETTDLFWGDGLLIGRLGIWLGRRVTVEAQGDLAFPLLRHEFGFNDANGNPTGDVFVIPTVSGGAELHVGVHFP
ncbi:MAG TPA: hypothetical protein VFV94_02375 [Polyangiaceae bacterium]|nr:hypothetical protein [Polyangiaceae bacterium]